MYPDLPAERLHAIGLRHRTDKATFHGFCDFYEHHLPARVDRLLEIGVMDGCSLRMWREYYPGASAIVGVDIRPPLKIDGVQVLQLDATEPAAVATLRTYGPFDVIIDDGSHMTSDQQETFGLLWPAVRPGGSYVIEDLHTSYMSNYVDSPLTTLEFLAASNLGVIMFGRAQGEPKSFLSRHGFNTGSIEWLGADPAESITAIIRKPGA